MNRLVYLAKIEDNKYVYEHSLCTNKSEMFQWAQTENILKSAMVLVKCKSGNPHNVCVLGDACSVSILNLNTSSVRKEGVKTFNVFENSVHYEKYSYYIIHM